jgi:hypothetical protein
MVVALNLPFVLLAVKYLEGVDSEEGVLDVSDIVRNWDDGNVDDTLPGVAIGLAPAADVDATVAIDSNGADVGVVEAKKALESEL